MALLGQRFGNLGPNDFLHPTVDFPPAISTQAAIRARNVVPEEQQIHENGNSQVDGCNDPDDKREKHTEQNNGLLAIGRGEDTNVDEELYDRSVAV